MRREISPKLFLRRQRAKSDPGRLGDQSFFSFLCALGGWREGVFMSKIIDGKKLFDHSLD
jgi:hypothetical protein